MKIVAFNLVDRIAGLMLDFPEGRINSTGRGLVDLVQDIERLTDRIPITFVSERTQYARTQRLIAAVRKCERENAEPDRLRTVQ